jgi:hypothetical protein
MVLAHRSTSGDELPNSMEFGNGNECSARRRTFLRNHESCFYVLKGSFCGSTTPKYLFCMFSIMFLESTVRIN